MHGCPMLIHKWSSCCSNRPGALSLPNKKVCNPLAAWCFVFFSPLFLLFWTVGACKTTSLTFLSRKCKWKYLNLVGGTGEFVQLAIESSWNLHPPIFWLQNFYVKVHPNIRKKILSSSWVGPKPKWTPSPQGVQPARCVFFPALDPSPHRQVFDYFASEFGWPNNHLNDTLVGPELL